MLALTSTTSKSQAILILLVLLLATTCFPFLAAAMEPPPGRNVVRVRYGYFPQARPNHAACALGWFDLDLPNRNNTYYQVICYPQASGDFAASRLDNLQLDLANLGSTPWASAVARGIDAKAVYISMYMGESQGLYVRPDEEPGYQGIVTPYDLENRTVGVPFGSTMHYQILFLIDLIGLTGSVNVINMAPAEIITKWDDAKRDPPILDAAGCWGAAREHLLQKGAKTLASAGLLADWGRPTFVVTAVTRTFARDHPDFMVHFVGILSRMNDSYLDRLGQDDSRNVQRWEPTTADGLSYIPSMVDVLMKPWETPSEPSEAEMFTAREALDDFIQQSASEQLSCTYLGPEPRNCTNPTRQHIATHQTAEFLLDQKILGHLGPLASLGDDEQCQNPDTFCGSDIFDGQYLQQARRSCTDCLPVGPYADSVAPVSSSLSGPDELLSALEERSYYFNHSGFASNEIGRSTWGDSNCEQMEIIAYSSPTTGQFGDGANGERGKSYSDNLNCRWEIRGLDCDDMLGRCQSIVEIKFERLRVWSGDYIRVYTDPEHNCDPNTGGARVLLAQLSGIYDDATELPILRARGCISVVFDTDANMERTYGDDYGDGFLFSYDRYSSGCSDFGDCNGHPCLDGMCDCGPTNWGGDCSFTDFCLGTSRVELEPGMREVIASRSVEREEIFSFSNTSALNPLPDEAYPNDLDCRFELMVPDGYSFVKVDVYYDLETSFDLLWLLSGSDTYAVLTGMGVSQTSFPEVYYLPTKDGSAHLHLTTDMRGRRRGFYATLRAVNDDARPDGNGCHIPGQSGSACEFEHCIQQNRLAFPKTRVASEYVLGRVVSQTSKWLQEHRTVPAMPWAADPDGGCTWSLTPDTLPADVVALRLVFNSPLDLEPHPATAVGDKLIIRTPGSEDTKFFVEQCDSKEACSFPWQTGICTDRGGCDVRTTWEKETDNGALASALLVTDRNDRGKNYTGLDFDVLLVKQCPYEDDMHCETNGGSCIDGFCYCGSEETPCSCTCEGEPPSTISTGVKIGIVLAVVVPVFVIFFAAFLVYRRRKIRKSHEQKLIIAAKEAELEEFRNSVVGMCTAVTKYVPVVQEGVSEGPLLMTSTPGIAPSPVWCWKETEGYMDEHEEEEIFGDPNDRWIKYDEDSNSRLELAFQEQGRNGKFELNSHYSVDFSSMIQTKRATGFQRDVQRVSPDAAPEEELDLSDVKVGDATKFPEELKEEPQMVLVSGDVIQISRQRPDGLAFGSKLYHADEALARRLVSFAVGGASVDDSSVLTDTGWFALDATRVPTTDDLTVLQNHVGDTGVLDPPEYWDPVLDPTIIQHHELDQDSDEYQDVASAFLSTLQRKKKLKILGIKRIENLAMWQSYVVKRQTICYRETGQQSGSLSDESERKALEHIERRWLWHGTNAEVMDKIMSQGFNRSFCGKNATAFGKGVYFARDACYSADRQYAVPDKKGQQYILACRVVVGEYCRGHYDALTPDVRDTKNNILYDTTVGLLSGDTMTDPSIYVTYHDAQAYPEYLITFRS